MARVINQAGFGGRNRIVVEGTYVGAVITDGLRPALAGVTDRATDHKPFYQSLGKKWFENPDLYVRADRLKGEKALEKDGKIHNWSPGYTGKRYGLHTYHTRSGELKSKRIPQAMLISFVKKGVKISNYRPFMPIWKLSVEKWLAEAETRWLLDGILPTGSP